MKEVFSVKKGNEASGANPQKKMLITVTAVGVVIILALTTVIIMLLGRTPEVPEVQLIPGPAIGGYRRDLGGRGMVVTEENVEEVRAMLSGEDLGITPEDRQFEFGLVPNWTFHASTQPSPNALVMNSENNSRMIFFDVYIEGIGVVYVSPYMPLGSRHSNFALDIELEPGVYTAKVTHFLVDDDLEILTDVSVGVTITVEN